MKTVQERFEAKFEKDSDAGCWNWTAYKTLSGYGQFYFDGKVQCAQRVAYQLYIGEISGNIHVFHKCDNPSCVNPSHLFLGTEQKRFETKFKEDIYTDCWNWTAGKDTGGYGDFWLDGRMQQAHRVAYQLYIGEIPDGLCICHKCDNPACVNPSHLFPGTMADNMHDRDNKGRGADLSGEKSPHAKLTEEQAETIREMRKDGVRSAIIEKEFGVGQSTISRIDCYQCYTKNIVKKENK